MKTRVLTAALLIPLVLAVVGCTNPWPLAVVVLLATLIALKEAAPLCDGPRDIGIYGGAIVFLPFLIRGLEFPSNQRASTVFVVSALAALGVILTLSSLRVSVNGLQKSVLRGGFPMYIVCAMLGVLLLHCFTATGQWSWQMPTALLILLFPVWAGDIAAMLGGKAFGKHLMAPTISPKKTWEGAICNFVASLLVGWGVGAWLGYQPWVGWACGAAVGVFGQLGDLFESALKRAAGVKDSGSLLPGHGGLLDRIDALLGSVIPVWLILHFSGSLG